MGTNFKVPNKGTLIIATARANSPRISQYTDKTAEMVQNPKTKHNKTKRKDTIVKFPKIEQHGVNCITVHNLNQETCTYSMSCHITTNLFVIYRGKRLNNSG